VWNESEVAGWWVSTCMCIYKYTFISSAQVAPVTAWNWAQDGVCGAEMEIIFHGSQGSCGFHWGSVHQQWPGNTRGRGERQDPARTCAFPRVDGSSQPRSTCECVVSASRPPPRCPSWRLGPGEVTTSRPPACHLPPLACRSRGLRGFPFRLHLWTASPRAFSPRSSPPPPSMVLGSRNEETSSTQRNEDSLPWPRGTPLQHRAPR
jgi:hypothetical protein